MAAKQTPTTTGRLTAAEARSLSGTTPTEAVDALLVTVKDLASKGRRQCRTGYDHSADTKLWVHGGYDETNDWKEAVKQLEALGYKVSFFYEERQFVDMYTLVEW